MSHHKADYYSLLGIGRRASADEIDRAYRRAARATHPDVNPEDNAAGERFKAVTIAYETLRSPEQRASYDRAHAPTRSGVPVTVMRRRPAAADVAPVHLGRRPQHTELLQPFRDRRHATPGALVGEDLFDLFAAVSRLLERWPFP